MYLFVNLAIPEVSRDGTSLQSTSFSCNPQSSVSAIRVIANWCLDYLSNWLHVRRWVLPSPSGNQWPCSQSVPLKGRLARGRTDPSWSSAVPAGPVSLNTDLLGANGVVRNCTASYTFSAEVGIKFTAFHVLNEFNKSVWTESWVTYSGVTLTGYGGTGRAGRGMVAHHTVM